LRTGEKHCTESLQALVREKKGPAQVPKMIEFVDELPLTAVGKIDKKSLRASYKLCSGRTVTQ